MEKNKNLGMSTMEVNELVKLILHHKKAYYGGKAEISDPQYDRLEETLKALIPDHPVLSLVGDGEESQFRKISHNVPMLSLAKTYELQDVLDWAEGQEVMATLKIDGNSLSLVYQSGELKIGKTRGNGREGEDVTDKIRWVSECIPKIPLNGHVEVRGELYCSDSSFLELADEMVSRGMERPSNPRNIVSGILGRKQHQDLARYFNFFAFELLDSTGFAPFTTEVQKFESLQSFGFKLPDHKLCPGPDDVSSYLQFAQSFMEEGDVQVDGVVFSFNELAKHRELGSTSHHPRYKLSFKWAGETAVTVIQDIVWATSRLGIVTPVAIVEPVYLSGANLTNVTLHNAAHVSSYNVKVGDQIEIIRSGEVIPKFLSVISSSPGVSKLPEKCPSCGSTLNFDGVRLLCNQNTTCPAQISGTILNWIRAVDIEDLSDKRLQLLIDHQLIRTIPDLYRLKMEDFLKLPNTKEKMAQKLFENITASKNPTLAKFLRGLGIGGLGQASWIEICRHYGTLSGVRTLNATDLLKLDGFADKTAAAVVEGLERVSPIIDELLSLGISPVESTEKKGVGVLSGMTFAITGALSKPREYFEELIETNGGKVVGSVSKKTSILLTNESASSSSKAKKAADLGVKIWTEVQFLEALQT
jgi:DNA ligase (NAD+)